MIARNYYVIASVDNWHGKQMTLCPICRITLRGDNDRGEIPGTKCFTIRPCHLSLKGLAVLFLIAMY